MFLNRHLGPNESEIAQMTQAIGVENLDALIDETIPADIRLQSPLDLPDGISEFEFQRKIQKLAKKE